MLKSGAPLGSFLVLLFQLCDFTCQLALPVLVGYLLTCKVGQSAVILAGSEDFKWGAITGVIAGGSSKAISIYRSSKVIPTPRESELKVLKTTDGAIEQVSYLDGKIVSSSTKGATRPDVVIPNADGTVKAIEVKNYNLESYSGRSELLSELERQVTSRAYNLPAGSTQEIVLDVRGRGFSTKLIDSVISSIKDRLNTIYFDIPVKVLRY